MIFSFFSATALNFALLFIVCFASSLGFPGGDIWLVSTGALAATSSDLIPVISVGFVAALLGDLAAYLLAYRFSSSVYRFLNRYKKFKENELSIRLRLAKSEFALVFLSRFLLTGLGAAVSYISGFTRLNRRKFIVAAILGDILYAAIYILLGFFFKEVWMDLTSIINEIVASILLLIIIYFLIKIYLSKRKSNHAAKVKN